MTAYLTQFERAITHADLPQARQIYGRVAEISAQSIKIDGLNANLGHGDLIGVRSSEGRTIRGEVIGLTPTQATAIMHSHLRHVKTGQKVFPLAERALFPSDDWIGRVLNHEGRTIDGALPKDGDVSVRLTSAPPPAILRKALGPRLSTGLAALDTFLPLCQGQRVGLFSGSGVGKSTLLGTLARSSNADINVIALIGERGREVRHFVEKTLGPEGMKKSIVFAATSDASSAIKLRTARLAMATAEYFRDQGRQVLFLFDSLTRFAESHRDIALTAGEVPALRAYPPSTFRALAGICERAGPGVDGSGDITAVFSVLVAGSDMEEPVADMVRGILDGHIILDREIAERGRFPAINIRQSVSRALPGAATPDENSALQVAREHIMRFEEARNIIQAGLYVAGGDPKLDAAIKYYPNLDAFVSQTEMPTIKDSFELLELVLQNPETIAQASVTQSETKP